MSHLFIFSLFSTENVDLVAYYIFLINWVLWNHQVLFKQIIFSQKRCEAADSRFQYGGQRGSCMRFFSISKVTSVVQHLTRQRYATRINLNMKGNGKSHEIFNIKAYNKYHV